jgi:hypothetical protein
MQVRIMGNSPLLCVNFQHFTIGLSISCIINFKFFTRYKKKGIKEYFYKTFEFPVCYSCVILKLPGLPWFNS